MQLRHYTEQQLSSIEGILAPRFKAPHFKEFVFSLEEPEEKRFSVQTVLEKINQEKVLGGISLNQEFPKLGQSALVCVTELHTKEDIDRFGASMRRALEVE